MTDYSSIIKDIRARLGLTQQALANGLEVWKSTVQMWEMGRKKPSLPSLRNLARLVQKEGLEIEIPMDAAIAVPAPSPAPAIKPGLRYDSTPTYQMSPRVPDELQLRREQLRAVRAQARRKRLQREGK